MSSLALHVSEIEFHSDSELSPGPRQLKDWLSALPVGESELAAEELLVVMNNYNRCGLAPLLRYQEMEVFGAVVGWLIKDLSSKYSDSYFPLSGKNRHRFDLVDRLLAEWALGYKLVVKDLCELHSKSPLELVLGAINRAVMQLSKQLLSRYSVYICQPDGVWSDLHHLYRYAEELAGNSKVTKNEKYAFQLSTIFQAYRRIVLLSITNPYHLMPQEAQLIYNNLKKWAADCQIHPLTEGQLSIGDLIVDLESDSEPYFLSDLNLKNPEQIRTLNMEALVQRFSAALAVMKLKQKKIQGAKISFNERKNRDMLLRLQSVWNGRLERKAPREKIDQKITLISGLSAVHYFIDEEQDFSPEYDEIKFFRPEDLKPELSLVPAEYEPWKQDELEHQASVGIDNARLSTFNDTGDVWKKNIESEEHIKSLRQHRLSNFNAYHWQLINQSADGLGLKREPNSFAKAGVGNLIAFKDDQPGAMWEIGVVKWLIGSNETDFGMGLSVLHGKPLSIAVRCVKGTGLGSEYLRCIIMNQHLDKKLKPVLFTPASIFDAGSMLILNRRTEMSFVKLTSLISTSAGFSKFEFEQVPISKEELTELSRDVKHK